ncbi:hypothetical protein [Saccharomonospora halophila]|uniref:hypothetical protein n=1 Tax=Saccharomonospora halophila TaxID=129922 RepID=UPI0005858ED5|nr:hypothetical protein [Saccharomonospora halophila]
MTADVARANSARSGGFAAFMHCSSGDHWLSEAEAQTSAWLRNRKNYDVPLDVSGDYGQASSSLSVRRLTGDGRDDLRIRLVEDQGGNGTWTTELIAHDEPGDHDWINLTVRNDQGKYVNVPKLARFLIEALPLRDGSIEFSGKPTVYHEADIDRLMSLLADERRHGLVFVAGSDSVEGLPFDPYVRKLDEWTRETNGLAQVVVLDPAATRAFARRVGDRYAAPAWTIRTYGPGVEFEDERDFRRHRILGTQRLTERPDHATRRLLGEIVREQAATRPADQAVLRVQRRFDRHENRRLVEAVEPTEGETSVDRSAPAGGAPEDPRTVVDSGEPVDASREVELAEQEERLALVKQMLGITSLTEHEISAAITRIAHRHADVRPIRALERRVDDLQLNVFELEDHNEKLHTELVESQEETQLVYLELDDRDARIRWLENRLKDRGDYEAPYVTDIPKDFYTSYPESFEGLLERLDQIDGVTFTGDANEVARLNLIDTDNAAVRAAWDAVLCLGDYVKARRSDDYNSGLDQYIKNPPSGFRTVPKGKWGRSETKTTMNAYGDDRVFPVPETVDPSGYTTMTAHFKLAKIGMRSPRMYIHDAHPTSPCVYIGYIGEHLTNMQTN